MTIRDIIQNWDSLSDDEKEATIDALKDLITAKGPSIKEPIQPPMGPQVKDDPRKKTPGSSVEPPEIPPTEPIDEPTDKEEDKEDKENKRGKEGKEEDKEKDKEEDKEGKEEDKEQDGDEDEDEDEDTWPEGSETLSQQNKSSFSKELPSKKAEIQRVVDFGKKAIKTAENKKLSEEKINKIKEAIEDLETNIEAYAELETNKLAKKINTVLDLIDKIQPVQYTDADIETRIKEIEQDFTNVEKVKELTIDDNINRQKDFVAKKAKETETRRYSHLRPISDFKINFYRAIKDQVEKAEDEEDTFAEINRRMEGEDIIKPGVRMDDILEDKPSVSIYFDQSGSWSEKDINVGKRAIASILDFANKGELILKIYYFANHIFTSPEPARKEGGTSAWYDILAQIKADKAKNVVLMTDTDMSWQAAQSSSCVVPGYVWFLWRDGQYDQDIINKLQGKLGTKSYQFKTTD